MTKKFQRRILLRGLGGAAVLAPFLKSVEERAARAQGAPIPEAPRRLIVMFTHYGCITTQWFPQKSHGALAADDFTGTTLEPLAPMADKLLLPRGMRVMNEWTPDASLGQGNGPHINVCGSYFTCAPLTPHLADPFDLANDAAKFEAMPTAPSLDHVCAQQLSGDQLPLFMHVSGRTGGGLERISFSAPEEWYQGLTRLEQVIGQLTGLVNDGPMSPDSYRAARGKSALDLIRADLESLERYDMSQADRHKLEAWKELLHQTTTPVIAAACNAQNMADLGPIEGAETTTDISVEVTQGLDRADLFSNAAVLAAACNLNQVIFLEYPGNYVFGGLGLTTEIDSMNHRTGSAQIGGSCTENVTQDLLTVDRYYARKFAHLIQQLDAIDEGDGSLLDHSATVWFHETSDGGAMNTNNMPIIQAGGCSGYFKTGHAVNLFDGTPDLHRGNSEAPCVDGAFTMEEFKNFGTPSNIGNAPINKYYCSLMNAIGVKAGVDGFPQVGGTREVTHFGMYDDTTDFASGGSNPPQINDPGEFSELGASS